MPAKIKSKFKSAILSSSRKIAMNKTKKKFATLVKGFIKDAVIDSIEKGLSPVKMNTAKDKNTGGKSRYVKYSDSYTDKIKSSWGSKTGKRQRPINLKLTGKLLNSLKAVVMVKRGGLLRLWFSDEKAKYHDKLGAGKSRTIRRMLPNGSKGEEFNRAIQRKIIEAAGKAAKDLL